MNEQVLGAIFGGLVVLVIVMVFEYFYTRRYEEVKDEEVDV